MKRVYKYSVLGFVFVSVYGTLSHFLYKLSGNSIFVGLFCPINESIWEHIKLFYFSYLLWTIIEYFITKRINGMLFAKLIGAFAGMVFIPVFFYTYTGIIEKSIEFINILSFFIAVLIAFVTDYLFIKSGYTQKKSNTTAIICFIAVALLFILFTFAPPFVPLFRDPITFTYGI